MSAESTVRIPDGNRRVWSDALGVRVLLADREGAGRSALASLLHSIAGVELVGEVASRDDLGLAVRRLRPDVVVIDDRLLNAVDHALTGSGPIASKPRVIVVGVIDDPAFAARARRLGADAWIAKDRAADDLPAVLGVS